MTSLTNDGLKTTLKKKYILAIDQGTTGTTLSFINESGVKKYQAYQEFPQHFPKPGWVEHDLEDIWKSFLNTLKNLLETSKVPPKNIIAIGITNQRETVGAWNRKTHKTYGRAIVWQCRRTSEFCSQLKKRGLESQIKKKTGLVLDPYFSASKVRWLIKQKVPQKDTVFGTIDTYLLFRLTNGVSFKTDISNASRTQLMNLKTACWDPDLLKIFSVPKGSLADIVENCGLFGVTKNTPYLLDGTPIGAMLGDQQAALFGQTCFEKGSAKCTFGTGSFILLNTGKEKISSSSGLLTTVAWKMNGQTTYALEGGAFMCGASVQWLRDNLKLIGSAREIEALARTVKDCGGVTFVPSLAGLGPPYWAPEARGLISGLTRATTSAHIARATLEAMAFQNADILRAMKKDLKTRLKTLRVDGGAASNNLLLQMQANVLGCRLERPQNIETTSLGAGLMAGKSVGLWKSLNSLKKLRKLDKSFSPQISTKQRQKRLLDWKKAVLKTLWQDTPSSNFKRNERLKM